MPPVRTPGRVAAIDDRAAGPATMSRGGGNLFGFIDESGLNEELIRKNPNYGPHNPHPFAAYVDRVLAHAKIPVSKDGRAMAADIAGRVARLPFCPDHKDAVETRTVSGKAVEMTEFDLQAEKTAKRAEEALDSEAVWTGTALRIARAALELREQDPNGEKGIAWVNDPLPGEPVAA